LALRTGVAQYRNLDVAASLATYRLAMDAHREVKNYSGWAEALEGWIRAQISHDSAAAFRLVDCPEIAEFFAEIGPGPNHSRARARVEASYSEILFAAERPEATEVGARAFEVSQAEGDLQVTVHSAVALGLASWQQMRLEESARWFELGLEAARGGDDDWIQAWPLQRLPLPLISLGRLREATSVADRAAALAEGTHDWAEFSLTRATQCILALFQGTFDGAETFASDAALMYRRSDYQWIPPVLFPAIGQARLLRGDFQAASHAAELLSQSGLGGPAWLLKMLQLAYEGRTDLLAREFAANASRAGRKYPDNIFSAGPLAMRADLAALTATPEYAPDSIPRLKEFLKHGLLFSLTQGAYLLPRALADLEAVSGQWSDAEEHYAQAIAVARASRARTELALSLSGRARLLESRGDSEAAALLAEEANLAFGQIGIVPPLDRRTRERPGAQGRRRTSASAGEDPLDLEILSDYSRGLSVRQSAARLLLSERSLAARLAAQRDRNLLRSPDSAVTYLREIGHRSGAAPSRTDGIQAFLVSDIVGSTRINAQIGDSAWVQLLQQHNEILRSAMEAFEGTEVKHTGDGIFAVFNSAANAVGCALAAARRFPVLETSNHSIRADVCMGISVGEAVGVQDDLFGLAVTQAFRICDRAGPGEVLVAEPVRQLLEGSRFSFEERGRFVLKGFKGRNLLYRASLA
jgi:class 3 adenylate cyclase